MSEKEIQVTDEAGLEAFISTLTKKAKKEEETVRITEDEFLTQLYEVEQHWREQAGVAIHTANRTIEARESFLRAKRDNLIIHCWRKGSVVNFTVDTKPPVGFEKGER